eukprot:m.304475 g.304475  ORF g.304475 m.304475 type:complete len:128 (-) comp19604_c0_seq1:96-479(-)
MALTLRTLQMLQRKGLKPAIYSLFREGKVVEGTLVGTDELGNKYYENNDEYHYGSNRWVDYANYWHSDASQVTSNWHGWLHYITDKTPTNDKPSWGAPFVENLTGTKQAYVPYSTTKPKIQAWQPPQ